jgi:polyisoprenoid-binding protein YceI
LALVLSCLVFVVNPARLQAQDTTVEFDLAGTKIEFTLGASFHTVHGTFQLKSGTIHFNPATGAASGIVIADATSADTGNKSRDRKMHAEVLESRQYPEVTFSPTRISGSVALPGDSTIQVEGIFRLHGNDHPIELTVPVQISGGAVTARTRFTVPYVAWGLRNPSNLFLHVSDKVEVEVSTTGRITK